MAAERPGDVREWLDGRPPLKELRDAYPDDWAAVKRDVQQLVARGNVDELKARVLEVSQPLPAAPRRERRRRGEDAVIRAEIRRQMTAEALRQVSVAAATGVTKGKVRFKLVSGKIAQSLFFEHDLVRKPVSMARFRMLWPMVRQKEVLMPLVQPKGIYCFYSGKLVRELAALIGDRSCLEIAAGDGTLSRFLANAGVDVTPTDDHSWSHTVDFPESVVQEDAATALRTRAPQAVVCSWPPPGNAFEHDVFETGSVELYIVIGSKHEFGAGDWIAYRDQDHFEWAEEPQLSALVLPPELESAVYVFRRRS